MNNEIFRLIRMQKRLSQRKFAEVIGISSGLVSLIEINERPVTRSTANKVMEAFKLTDEDLLTLIKLRAILEGGGIRERKRTE